ncbi:MAG: hypothetical protein LUC24_02350 [Bacteroidales bacterium]|nr:hypothetical protein [Bacteroidales bacterium]
MRVETATLCRHASVDDGGLSIEDPIGNITLERFPDKADFCFAASVNVEDIPSGPHRITMSVINEENMEENTFETFCDFRKSPKMRKIYLTAGLKGLIFDASGSFRFCVTIDNSKVISHPFKVLCRYEGKI